VTQLISTALVLVVSPELPVNTVKELISYVKSRPGKSSYASGGIGSPPHLAGELLKSMVGLDIVHVPFGGGGPAITETMANRVVLYFAGTASARPFVPERLKALAVTSKNRSPAYPDTPTMIEAGVADYVVDQWYAILAPRDTPRSAIARLNSEFAKALKLPDVKERLNKLGVEPVGSTPEQFGAYLKAEIVKYEKIVKASGARVD
jgi:tripartite-type tricarboxylate transporter receptor subunit TctC